MKTFATKLLMLSCMLIGFPIIGITIAGYPIKRYLEFPPETVYIHHASFSWAIFLGYTILISLAVLPLLILAIKNILQYPIFRAASSFRHPFPWWGWAGLFFCVIMWIMTWTRFQWFKPYQPHTFFPLWGSFILVINATSYRRTGKCMLTHEPLFFMLLFPLSAGFWWFFEYLNRFVQNWHYLGVQYSPKAYFFLATLSFSTVLPAVLAMQELMMSFEWIAKGFSNKHPVNFAYPIYTAIIMLILSGTSLLLLGIYPDLLYPILWISPLVIIVSLQTIQGEPHILSPFVLGRWDYIVSFSLAALCCGLFWEMWNFYSLAKWKYSIPFVHRFQIFEMPVLGYAGYLPFGLECAVVGNLLKNAIK